MSAPRLPSPSRDGQGWNDADPRSPMAYFNDSDPARWFNYFTDWNDYTSAQWSLTGGGSPTAALASPGIDGLLTLTTGATSGNTASLQKTPAAFYFVAGRQLIFRGRFSVSSFTSIGRLGLVNGGATFGSETDGFHFSWNGSTAMSFTYLQAASSVSVTQAFPTTLPATTPPPTSVIHPATNAPFYPAVAGSLSTRPGTAGVDFYVGAYYDGVTTLTYYWNDVAIGDIQINTTANPLTAVALSPLFGIQTSSNAAITMQSDFIFAARQRW